MKKKFAENWKGAQCSSYLKGGGKTTRSKEYSLLCLSSCDVGTAGHDLGQRGKDKHRETEGSEGKRVTSGIAHLPEGHKKQNEKAQTFGLGLNNS